MGRRRLEGCLAIVTGASSGIGRAIALELARFKGEVILTARREAELTEVAAQVESLGAKALTVVGDLTDPDLRLRLIDSVASLSRPLDLLINNAGVSAHGRFLDASPDRLSTILSVNLTAACELTRAAIPAMRGAAAPAVMNVGSILAYRGVPFNSEYCASKAALRVWSEALRIELLSQGVDVTLLTPGTTDTPFVNHLIEKQGDLPWAGSRGLSAEYVAKAAIKGLQRRRREVTPGLRAKAFVLAARWAPGLMDLVLRRYG